MLAQPGKWFQAMQALRNVNDPALKLELLKEAVSRGDLTVRKAAMHELSSLKSEAAVQALVELLETADPAELRGRAADSLGRAGSTAAIGPLLRAFASGDPDLRLAAAVSLRELGHSGPDVEVIDELKRDLRAPDGAARRLAVEKISWLRSPAAFPSLVGALEDSNGDVRAAAVWGLLSLKDPRAIPLLEGLRKDPIPEVVQAAEEALAELRGR